VPGGLRKLPQLLFPSSSLPQRICRVRFDCFDGLPIFVKLGRLFLESTTPNLDMSGSIESSGGVRWPKEKAHLWRDSFECIEIFLAKLSISDRSCDEIGNRRPVSILQRCFESLISHTRIGTWKRLVQSDPSRSASKRRRGSRVRHRILWVGLWSEILRIWPLPKRQRCLMVADRKVADPSQPLLMSRPDIVRR
jgi:hypothetical protein